MIWIDWLRQLLCKLYEDWDGNCADLGKTPQEWADTVIGEFDKVGAPSFPTQADKDTCLDVLTELDSCLADPQNSLDPALTHRLIDFSTELRVAINQ